MEHDDRQQDQQTPQGEAKQAEPTATVKKVEGRADIPEAAPTNHRPDEEKKYRGAIVFLTAGLLASTVAYSIAAYWQLTILEDQAQAMRETLKETKGIAEQTKVAADAATVSAKAAQDSADAAKESNRITLQTTRNDQRAWVGVSRFLGKEIKPGVEMRFGVRISNFGRTPARSVRTQTSWSALPRSTPFTPVYPPRKRSQQASASVVMPTFEGEVLAPPVIFTESQVKALESQLSYFYVYGRITYDDVFGHPHFTTWCFYVAHDSPTMTACETYNDAD